MRTAPSTRPCGPRVLVCRGCCCGTDRKHPTTDHHAQVTAFERSVAEAGAGSVAVVGCLGRCDRSNVIVVKHARHRALWLGPVLSSADTAAVAGWLRDGAPVPPPPAVDSLVFERHQAPSPTNIGRSIGARR
jgi:hypothetical protein